ncbi:MAG TPA: sigma 54-interacting transcriptional regulator, partial [Methylomirabilota bacterium]
MDLSDDLPGNSPGIVALREKVALLLRHQTRSRRLPTVLIQGETGTGKGYLADVIHRRGPRASGPFINVSCAAIPDTLAEAELFGKRRGAFTGANESQSGLFQAANRGIIFLDEAGLLSDAVQTKLLKVIDEREVRPVGTTRSERVDMWVIAATNEDLTAANPSRHFRRDLYYRLSMFTLALPPLRERGDDIILLAERFLARACEDHERLSLVLAPDARAALLAYDWPGNVRELSNVIERVAAFSEMPQITAEMLALPRTGSPRPPAPARRDPPTLEPESSDDDDQHRISRALLETGWNIARTAVRLGMSRNRLRYRMEKHGLVPGSPGAMPGRSGAGPTTPPPEAPPPIPAPAPRWEPRRVTLLRVTLVRPLTSEAIAFGSRGPEAFKTFVEKVQSFGGRVEEFSRTGVVAAFGLEPTEGAPLHAAHAALAIQKAVERANRGEANSVATRITIHVGQFLIGQVGGGVQMDLDSKREAWSALEALEADAEPNTIVVSGAAEPFLKRRFDLVPLDAGGDRMAYRLAGRGTTRVGVGSGAGPFVGPRQDLALLHSRLASASSGRGQFVGIVGEAGIGKSRLLLEFRRSLSGMPVTDLEGHCFSYGTAVPYLPIIEMLKQNFGITGVHGAATITERVRAGLQALGMEPAEWLPFFLQLLGVREGAERLASLSPEAIKARTVEGLRQMLVRGSRLRPLIVVLEDLHWIDRTSEECLAALVEVLAGSPILFVATYRPGYHPAWLVRSYATQVPIQPLSSDDSLSVVRSILRTEQVPETVARLILDKAEGNPFFLEELSRAVGEHGSLHPTLTVPDTIQEVLLARIRRLPESPKEILQTASVLGREISLRLLATIWDEPTTPLEPHLTALMRLEFLYQKTESAEPVYVFKHALTQEVAYESLAGPRREALHAAAGAALEQLYADHLEDAFEQLAYHFARTDQPERAAHYLTRFARKAAALYAHEEAV